MILFKLRKTRGDFVVDWREFVAFEAESKDYIFKKDIKNSFIEKIDAQLSVIDRVKLELNAEQYNSEICFRYESVLKTVKEVLEESVQSENVFLKRW